MTDIEKLLDERRETHGDFAHVATVAQQLKQFARTSARLKLGVVQQEAMDMIASKIGRILAGNPNEPDHWRDIAGYAELAARDIVSNTRQPQP